MLIKSRNYVEQNINSNDKNPTFQVGLARISRLQKVTLQIDMKKFL